MQAIFTSDVNCLKLDNYLNRILPQPSTVWGRLLHRHYVHVLLAAENDRSYYYISDLFSVELYNRPCFLNMCLTSLDDRDLYSIIKGACKLLEFSKSLIIR